MKKHLLSLFIAKSQEYSKTNFFKDWGLTSLAWQVVKRQNSTCAAKSVRIAEKSKVDALQ
ncbi:MAG: hypothetical protein AAF699_05170 [Pseudomonadota bacterium]